MTQKNELTFAAGQFPALEINGTFYGLQKPESLRAGRRQRPTSLSSPSKARAHHPYAPPQGSRGPRLS
ncbi:MAG: DUF72 domain-containing protein [Kaiparowitsia implicata GSE-PSE-MK54-09C]|nr:DUF72 domain-containing protein [Kaiparowitsia implicata GSE-PSE-MK54-09C]